MIVVVAVALSSNKRSIQLRHLRTFRKIVPSAIDPTCVADGPFRLWVLYIAHTQLGVKKSCWDQERAHSAFENQSERTLHIVETDRGKPKF